jgi:undecaprenyl-diphosphatase
MFGSIVLGIVQGVTEFFPISSTAHLVILPWVFKWQGLLDSLTFDVALHGGTLISLLICFRKDIVEIIMEKHRLMLVLIVGTLPAGVAGVLLHDYVESTFRSPVIIALTLVVFGLVMYFSERFRKGKKVEGVSFLDAVIIGFAQAVALVPGVSRSGITISAGLTRGFRREEAARFSFLLSIPVVAGATVLEGKNLLTGPADYDLSMVAVGFFASMITGILAIKFLLRFLKRHTMNVFVVYRFVLAGVIVGWLWIGG